jgi:DNA-binding transcriptional ArsR family regulator
MNGTREEKRALLEEIARVGKALAAPARLELLDVLAQGERSVEDLAAAVGLKLTTVSAHLQELRRAGLVTTRRDGTRIHYSLAGDDVLRLLDQARTLAVDRLPAAAAARDDYLGDPVEAIDRDELRRRLRAGDVVLLDVRPRAEYDAGHIDGARSIPIDELDTRLGELPADTEIVAYCRGPLCAFAHDAVRTLTSHGHQARRLDDGYPQWRLAGHRRTRTA